MVTAMVIEYSTRFMGHPATLMFDVMLESTITGLYESTDEVHVDAVHVTIDGKPFAHVVTGAAFSTFVLAYRELLLDDATSIAAEDYWTEKWSRA